MKFYISTFLFVLGVFSTSQASEANIPEGGLPTESRTLIVETIHPFNLTRYAPAKKYQLVLKPNEVSYKEPISALIENVSAMKAMDFNRFLSTWTVESREKMLNRNRQLNRTSDYWTNQWNAWSFDSSLELISWIRYGKYVLLEYQVASTDKNKKVFRDTVALEYDGTRWQLTQALAENPVLNGWSAKSGRIQVLSNNAISGLK